MNLPALLQFLDGLAKNNNRPWFVHNKPAYDILREEFTELVADLIQRIARFDPAVEHIDPKKCLFRIYRDTRFAKDKSPYKTHFSAMIGDRKAQDDLPWYYLQIDHKGVLGVGGGIYQPQKATLERIRRFIVADPDKFSRLLKNKRIAGTYGGLYAEDRMVRPPKGYTVDTAHIEQIKNRHFIGFVETTLSKEKPKDLGKTIAGYFEDLYPLIVWLREAVR